VNPSVTIAALAERASSIWARAANYGGEIKGPVPPM